MPQRPLSLTGKAVRPDENDLDDPFTAAELNRSGIDQELIP